MQEQASSAGLLSRRDHRPPCCSGPSKVPASVLLGEAWLCGQGHFHLPTPLFPVTEGGSRLHHSVTSVSCMGSAPKAYTVLVRVSPWYGWGNVYLSIRSLNKHTFKDLVGSPVQFLGWEDPLQKGEATNSRILGLPLWLSW